MSFVISRRFFVIGAPLALSACADIVKVSIPQTVSIQNSIPSIYDELDSEPCPVDANYKTEFDPQFLRQRVPYNTRYVPGTIVIDPNARFLYFVEPDGQATRYGVGVGREGFGWNGTAKVGRKAVWPTWTPPSTMIKRKPELVQYANGMPGGPENPLGARALYLYQGSKDTLYRMHGTNEPDSVGQAVSSGCIRLFNQDIIDLHRRVTVGSTVVVLPHS